MTRRPTRVDVAFAALLTSYAVAEAVLLRLDGDGSRLISVLLSAVLGGVFLWRRSHPVAVALVAAGAYTLRDALGAGPIDTYVYQVVVLASYYGAVVYGPRSRVALRLGTIAAGTVVARTVSTLGIHDITFMGTLDRALWAYLAALAVAGAGIGFQVRDRRADVLALRRRVEDLEAVLPEHGTAAAAAEQGRIAAEIRRLVAGLTGHVERLLADAERALASNPARAREILGRTADAARDTFGAMRNLVDRLAGSGDPSDGIAPAEAATTTLDELASRMRRTGARVTVRGTGVRGIPTVVAGAAARVAAAAAPLAEATVVLRARGLCVELAGAGVDAEAADAIASAERVRLLGGTLRTRPRRGELSVWLPLAPTGAARRRRPSPPRPRLDVPVALLLLLGLVDVVNQPMEAPLPVRVVFVAAVPLSLLARHRHPLVALLALEGFVVAGCAVGALGGNATQVWIAGLAACFFVGGAPLPLRLSAPAGVLAVAGPQIGMVLEDIAWSVPSYVSYIGMLAGAWVVGRIVRERLAAAAAARIELAGLEERRVDLAERAASAERARLARDLHDAVGQTILAVCVQAGAAALLAEQDEAGAREAIAASRAGASAAREELDRLTRIVPAELGDAGPGIADLPALAERLRATGGDVELRLSLAAPVPAELQAATYRIVQEALTNAAKHASGAPVTVDLRALSGRLRLAVTNDEGERIAAVSGGHGLRNMRDRAAEQGGVLHAGACAAGGWAVTATFPLAAGDRVAAVG